mmetsp:Transcript_16218/g.49076  ORF Transcript_16218/g.49076 Transcript_16218/m.49076 type:complete len:225 (-) Transcript_16218:663-1337(-)
MRRRKGDVERGFVGAGAVVEVVDAEDEAELVAEAIFEGVEDDDGGVVVDVLVDAREEEVGVPGDGDVALCRVVEEREDGGAEVGFALAKLAAVGRRVVVVDGGRLLVLGLGVVLVLFDAAARRRRRRRPAVEEERDHGAGGGVEELDDEVLAGVLGGEARGLRRMNDAVARSAQREALGVVLRQTEVELDLVTYGVAFRVSAAADGAARHRRAVRLLQFVADVS